MQDPIASAVFDNYQAAERAIRELREAGVESNDISVIGRHEGTTTETTGDGEESRSTDEPQSVIARAAAGSGIGALLGVAALAIPGVGPLAAAGAIAHSAIGGAALTGTAIGAAAGGLSDVLAKHGVDDDDSAYYSDRINQGGIFVSVQANDAGLSRDELQDILLRSGGHNASSARSSASASI